MNVKPILVLLAAIAGCHCQFNPGVSLTCGTDSSGMVYTISVTDAVVGGVVYIDGACAGQNITSINNTYTFDTAACTSLPALGSEFDVVVQELASVNQNSDSIDRFVCNADLSNVNQTESFSVTEQNITNLVASGSSLAPSAFTIGTTNSAGATVTSGEVGDEITFSLSISAADAAVFDFQIDSLVVSATLSDSSEASVSLITAGCATTTSVLAQPDSTNGTGSMSVTFNLFFPVNPLTVPDLSGTSVVSFDFSFEVCSGTCVAPSCSKRRRRAADDEEEAEIVDVVKAFVVYPFGMSPNKAIDQVSVQDYSGAHNQEAEACMSKVPLIGVMIALSVALIVCLLITGWMFCRLRRPLAQLSDKKSACHSNSGYKA